jgi:hypothetical protein
MNQQHKTFQNQKRTSQIPPRARPDRPEHVVDEGRVGRDRGLGGGLDHVDLVVQRRIKVAGHGAGVDRAYVNPEGLALNVQARRELAHEGLGRRVHGRERGGDGGGDAARENDAPPLLLRDQGSDKVVSDLDPGSGVALVVGQDLLDRGLLKEPLRQAR